jgi:hypothetical protein
MDFGATPPDVPVRVAIGRRTVEVRQASEALYAGSEGDNLVGGHEQTGIIRSEGRAFRGALRIAGRSGRQIGIAGHPCPIAKARFFQAPSEFPASFEDNTKRGGLVRRFRHQLLLLSNGDLTPQRSCLAVSLHGALSKGGNL